VQAFINDPDTILALVASDKLEESLEDLREMESVHIDIDPEKEEMVPRPDPDEEMYERAGEVLDEAEERLFDRYVDVTVGDDGLAVALAGAAEPDDADDALDDDRPPFATGNDAGVEGAGSDDLIDGDVLDDLPEDPSADDAESHDDSAASSADDPSADEDEPDSFGEFEEADVDDVGDDADDRDGTGEDDG
jgi:flagellar protein FlaI